MTVKRTTEMTVKMTTATRKKKKKMMMMMYKRFFRRQVALRRYRWQMMTKMMMKTRKRMKMTTVTVTVMIAMMMKMTTRKKTLKTMRRMHQLNTWYDPWLTQKTKKMLATLSQKRTALMKMLNQRKRRKMMGKLRPRPRGKDPKTMVQMTTMTMVVTTMKDHLRGSGLSPFLAHVTSSRVLGMSLDSRFLSFILQIVVMYFLGVVFYMVLLDSIVVVSG